MNDQVFVKKMRQNFNEISEENIKMLWKFYQTHYGMTLDSIISIYDGAEINTYTHLQKIWHTLSNAQIKIEDYQTNIFDAWSLEELEEMVRNHVKIYGSMGKLTTSEQKYVKQYIKKALISKYYGYLYAQDHVYEWFYLELKNYVDSSNKNLYLQNVTLCEYLFDNMIKLYKEREEEVDPDLIKEKILISYDEISDLTLDYQDRFNYVLGECLPSQNTILDISKFILDFYQDSQIPSIYKNDYLIYGYFYNYDLYADDSYFDQEQMKEGYDYYLNDYRDDKVKLLAENIDDYLHDEMKPNKDVQFLTGVLLAGVELYNYGDNYHTYLKKKS